MLFSIPYENDFRFFEAYVLGVDSQRKFCKILTDFKQSFDSVPWVKGIPEPTFNDKVLVSTVTGYPLILGVVPRVGDPSDFSPDIDDGTEIDTGNYSSLSNGLTRDPEKPKDIVSEDRVISNRMGGLFGLLKGGTFVARASKLSQIVLSKYDDLIRLVGRTLEIFTDAYTDVAISVRGRIYRFTGYSNSLAQTRGNVFPYQEHYGDTTLSVLLKDNYYGYTPATFAVLPSATDIVRKYIVTGSPNSVFTEDLHLTGQRYVKIQNTAGTAYTEVDQTNATFNVKTLNGTYVQITTTPTNVVITYNGSNTVTVDSSKVELNFAGNKKVTLNGSKIEADFEGTSKATLDASMIKLDFNGSHFVTVDASGVHLG